MKPPGNDLASGRSQAQPDVCRICEKQTPEPRFGGCCARCAARRILDFETDDPTQLPELADDPVVDLPPLFRLGEYEAIVELGRGGAGIVYRARHVRLQHEVALKVLLAGPFASASSRERFLREARAGVELDHRNIVRVFSMGEESGRLYCAMRWVRGGSLADVLARDPRAFPPRRAAALMLEVAHGVGHAHQRAILHRDLKPSNILLDDDDHPRIADFGLAHRMDGSHKLTQTGLAVGTPASMAPEQLLGKGDVTTATDVWGMGVILYQLLAGHPPFQEGSALALAHAITEEDPLPPFEARSRSEAQHRPSLTVFERDLETICLKCLAKEPASRYPTAEALADDLERCLGGHPLLARPVGPLQRCQRWCQRRPGIAALLALLLGVMTLLGVGGPLMAMRLAHARDDAVKAQTRTQQTLDRLESVAIVERSLIDGAADSLALVARRLRLHPTSRADAERALFLLSRHRFAVPQPSVLFHMDSPVLGYGRGGPWFCTFEPTQGRIIVRRLADTEPVMIWPRSIEPRTHTLAFDSWGDLVALYDGSDGIDVASVSKGSLCARIPWTGEGFPKTRFSSEGDWLAVFGLDAYTKIWRTRDWNIVASLSNDPTSHDLLNPGPRVHQCEFAPGGHSVATGSFGGRVEVYRLPDGVSIDSWHHTAPVACMAFNRDGTLLASAAGKNVTIRDFNGKKDHRTWASPDSAVTGLGFVRNGRFLAVGTQLGQIHLWDFAGGPSPDRSVQLPIPSAFWPPASLSGPTIVYAEEGGACWFDMDRGQVVACLPGSPAERLVIVGADPDGRELMARNRDGAVRNWRLPEFQTFDHTLPHDSEVVSSRFNREGTALATVAWSGEIRVWNLSDGRVAAGPRFHQGERAWRARFSPDGQRLATTGWSGPVKLWDPHSGKSAGTLSQSSSSPWWIDFTPDGQRLLTAGGWILHEPQPPAALQAWDVHRNVPIFGTGAHRFVWEPALSPDGSRWVVPDRSESAESASNTFLTLHVIRTADGADALPPLRMESRANTRKLINSTDYSPDGRWIAAGAIDHASVWNAQTGERRFDLPHAQSVRAVRFHPDSRRLLTAGEDGSARLWDLTEGTPRAGVHVMRHDLGHLTPIFEGRGIKDAEFSPDGRWIATGAADNTVRLWDADIGLPIGTPLLHAAPVLSVEFSPDGRWLVTGSADHTARLWRLFPGLDSAPAWLPDFLEGLAGRRLSELGEAQPPGGLGKRSHPNP